MKIPARIMGQAKAVWNALLGIGIELLMVGTFLITGFLVCTVWWVVIR